MSNEPEKYLVWSNEHKAWWGPDHCGYTPDVTYAGRYTQDEAIKICNGANYTWGNNSNPDELPIAESAALKLSRVRIYG